MSDIDKTPPVEVAVVDDKPAVVKPSIGWLSLLIAALFGFVYAYLVWLAIGNAINFPVFFEAVGHEDKVPWVLFVAGILVPILVYSFAFMISLRRKVITKLVVFIVGLSASAALGYTVIGLILYVLANLPVAK